MVGRRVSSLGLIGDVVGVVVGDGGEEGGRGVRVAWEVVEGGEGGGR